MTDREFQEYLKKFKVKTTQSSTGVTTQGTTQGTTEMIDGGFFEDMWTSIMQGWNTGTSVDEAFDVYKKGSSLTDDELQNYIEAAENINKYGPTHEQVMYQKAVKDNGGGFFGWAKAVAENFGYAPQAIATSLATMIASFVDSDEVAGYTLAGAGAGAGAGAAIGSTGFAAGPFGVLTTAGGAITGAVSGGIGGLVGAMETGLTLTELLKDELDGKEFNKENIRKILNDPIKVKSLKNKSLARGVTIGAVEGLTAGLSRGVGGAILKSTTTTGLKTGAKIAATTTGIEMLGGGGGEYLGQKAAGQEINMEDVYLEGFLEAKGIVNATDIIKAGFTKTEYNINGETRTEQDVIDILNDESLTNEEVSNIRINIVGNPILEAKVKDKQRKAGIGKNLDETITDSKDRQKLIELEIERLRLEEQKKQKGILKKIGIDSKIEKNQTDIDNILSKYESVDVAKLQEQTKTSVEQFNISESIAFAETEGKRIGKDVIVVDNDISAQEAYDKIIAEKGGKAKNVKSADGFIIGDSIVINKEVAGKSGQINVGGHEILHGILTKHLKSLDTNAKKKLIKQFKNTISRKSRRAVEKQIKANYADEIKNDENFLETTDEWLTVYSDLLKKEEISFNEGMFTQFRNFLHEIFRKFGYNKEFTSGIATYNFMKDYQKSLQTGKLSDRAVDVAGGGATVTEGNFSKSKAVDAVNKMEQGAETKAEFQKPGIFNNIYNSITQDGGAINNYVKSLKLSKEKFQETIDSLSDRLMNYDPATQRKTKSGEKVTIGEFLMANVGFAKLDAAKKLAIEGKRKSQEQSTDIGATTKEGDVKMQVEDTDASAQEILDEQDMSVEGIAKREAKETKAKNKRYSKLRQELGFETDGDTYKAVLDAARKSILLAYKKTLKITDPKARVDKIVDLIKKEYNSLNSDLFKPLKNFLGTKEYLKNLRKYGEAIVESISTADLVQMEKFTPDNERIFTTFVRKLTKKSDVQDAVNKNLLPKDALNTIDKGEAVNLYQKTIPTPNEIVGFANQPAINPVTGARSGLKGTRKDGFAKRIAESLILDAVMEVRQETEVQQTLTEDLNVEMDVQQLASKIGRDVDVKFSKSNAVADIDNAIDVGTDTGVYLQVRFSKSHRQQYENRLKKNRTDLTEEQRKNAVQSVFDFVDGKNIPDNKKSKYEKMAMHYMANGHLILPEDGYKVIEAEKLATKNKIDPFSVKDPNALIQTYVEDSKTKRTDPDKVKTFSNKTEWSNGVVVYDVEDSKQGQQDVRKVADTHFGPKFQNWCLIHRSKGGTVRTETIEGKTEAITFRQGLEEQGYIITNFEKRTDYDDVGDPFYEIEFSAPDKADNLSNAFDNWNTYNQEGNGFKVAFHNGKLVAFRDGNQMNWWDINDNPTESVVVKDKKVGDGFREVVQVEKNKSTVLYTEKQTGNKKNGTYTKKNLNGDIVEITIKKNGRKYGKQFELLEKVYYTAEITSDYDGRGSRVSYNQKRTYKKFKGKSKQEVLSFGKDQIRLDDITKWEKTINYKSDGDLRVTTIEGTVKQDMFEQAQNPDAITDPFTKTNFKYLVSSNERYFPLQGKKVTVKQTENPQQYSSELLLESKIVGSRKEANMIIAKARAEGKIASITDVDTYQGNKEYSVAILEKLPGGEALTINGEVQETRVKFSINKLDEVKHDILKGKNSVKNKNLQQHLYNFLARVNNQGKELTDEEIQVISEELSYIVPGKGVKKGYIMPERDRKLFVVIAKDLQNRNKYAKIDDPNLLSELIKDIVEARGKFNVGTALESKNKKILDSATSGELTDGPGDVYFVYDNGVVVGIESKAKDSQAVSQRVSNTKEGLSFPNKNETTNENNDLIDDVVIGGEIKNMHNKVNEFLVENNRKEIKDFSQELESDIARLLKENKEKFQGETEVDLIYVTSHMVTGRFQKSPQSIVSSEGDINTMESFDKDGNPTKSYALAIRIAEIFNNNIKDSKRQIKPLKLKEGKKVKVLISFEVTDKGEIKQRVRPQLKFKDFESSTVNIFKDKQAAEVFGKAIDQAASESKFSISKQAVLNTRPVLKYSKTSRGMSAFDFDETLIDKGENFILATSPNGVELKISSGQWPIEGPKLASEGYTFDFKDFVNVRGGVDGPLLQKLKNRIKKYGAKNNYILTARPPESATAIHGWLKTRGINIPLENITGLGNSTGEAKALWIADKYSQGYNDIYFVDDALPNVKAVADVINQLDIKGKSVQARVKFSKSLNKDFNDIIEDVKGIESGKRFSVAKGRARGQGKGRFRLFIPPSHEDFVGLLYNFIGFGEKGNKHRDFFEKALIKPLNRGFRELNVAKQAIANDYRALVKSMPEVRERLGEKILKDDYTVEDAIRVYLFDKAGYDIPGLTKTDLKNLNNFVKENSDILQFADAVSKISRIKEGYISPGDSWQVSNIRYDLVDATGRVGRAKFFTEFQENAEEIFGKLDGNGRLQGENINKIRAAFGDNFVEALQDMLYRIKTGNNRPTGNNRIVNRFLDWINGSVGATMFFNARSAVLQTLSTVNFINFGDNNIFKAATAFANQKQYWSDFAALFNSDFLKQRRSGAAFDVNANEIAREVAGSKNPVVAAIKHLLNIGFLPTQLADSFAIASGGATFYRNRVKTYTKQGLSQKEAESKAFIDFQEIAEATQQSARPDMVSQQQTSTLGRIILAFQNVTAQYARLIKKSTLDLVNRRRSRGYQTQAQSDMSNISRIIYYGAIQAVIFNALQNALFAMMFDEDEEDEKKTEKFFDTKKQRVINGTIDSLLKGLGVGGAVLATLKNYAIKLSENLEDDSFFKEPPSYELLQVSPPIGIKIRKIRRAEKNLEWNKDVLTELPLDNLDNPIYETSANYIEGFSNIPVARLLRKVQNISAALDSQNKWWQRVAVGLGWSRWDVGIKDNEIKEAKKAIRENNKRINKETKLKKATPEEKLKIIEKEIFDLNKSEQVKILEANNLNPKKYPKEADRVDAIMKLRKKNKTKIDSTINAIENYIPTEKEQRSIDLFKMNKKDQVNMLIDLGLSSKQIKKLKYEEDRVNKIIEIQNKSKK